MFENIGHGLERIAQMQSGSSSRSGHNRGAAVEADACNRGAEVEANTIGEQQLKRTQSGSSLRGRNHVLGLQGAAVEAGASGEQQVKQMQSGSSS